MFIEKLTWKPWFVLYLFQEISYIHAEAYLAGELKHGLLALMDADMSMIAVVPNNELLEKLSSNLQKVRACGGKLVVFAGEDSRCRNSRV